jgi:hypothetical protein
METIYQIPPDQIEFDVWEKEYLNTGEPYSCYNRRFLDSIELGYHIFPNGDIVRD